MQRILLTITLLAGAMGAVADYRGEAGIQYLRGSLDGSGSYDVPDYEPPVGEPGEPISETPPGSIPSVSIGDDDYDGWMVSGRYYLQSVDSSNGPLKLAPFISRASSIGGSYGSIEYDDSGLENDFWDVFARLVINGWVVEAQIGGEDLDSDFGDDQVDVYAAALGYYVAENTEVKVGFDTQDQDLEDYDRWTLNIEHVQRLSNGMTWQARGLYGFVNGDHDALSDVDGFDVEVDVSWFFSDAWSIGADYALRDRDDRGDTDYYRLWANWFATEKISLELSYFSEENDDFDIDSDGMVFEANYRF